MSLKIQWIKNVNNEQIKRNVNDALQDYIKYGLPQLKTCFHNACDHMDDMVNNDIIPDEMWYNFEKERDKFSEQLLQVEKSSNPKNTELMKNIKNKLNMSGLSVKKQLKE